MIIMAALVSATGIPIRHQGSSMALPQNVQKLTNCILDKIPVHRDFIINALDYLTEEELKDLSTYLDFCLQSGADISYIAGCYITIVEDTLQEQIHFMKHREYRHKSYAEVAGHVYNNDDYMNRYMYGLAVTSFFWPNHLDIVRFFRKTLPKDKSGTYLEIGPGHGFYLINAMRSGLFSDFLGIDISNVSIRQTQRIVGHFKPDLKNHFKLEKKDFLDVKDLKENSFDAIVMGEVLEHVEQPEKFIERIRALAKNDTYIFITTCINAPAVDHIYLWRSTGDLEGMIEGCGMTIKEALRLPYRGKTLEEAESENLAVNVAYVLEKRT
jgi:2-polyprenyl-3-methyl-5-hydroxy-6-metoxy-1,4-benzoquinol methylase